MDIINEKIITDIEAKKFIEELKGEVDELKYEQKNALGVLKNFVKIAPNKAEELVAELQKIEKLRERQIVAIVNALPQDTDELRAILQKEYSALSKEEVELILQNIKKVS